MKLRGRGGSRLGLTLVEVVVVICSLGLLALLLAAVLPAAFARPVRSTYSCAMVLKQQGLAFRTWEGDHNDRLPMSVSVTNGGAMELAESGDVVAIFEVMSNELGSPKVVWCPQDDSRHRAANFPLTPRNVSYFVRVNGRPDDPKSILGGDDNFEVSGSTRKSGLCRVDASALIVWPETRHRSRGNLLFADGSVQPVVNTMPRDWGGLDDETNLQFAVP